VRAGVPGITIHPREDQRHITAQDVLDSAGAVAALTRPIADAAKVQPYSAAEDKSSASCSPRPT
jgi:hypothetical protein